MLKLLAPEAWIYDAEWIPDAHTIRLVYGLAPDMPDSDVIAHAFQVERAKQERQGRAPDERPFLKLALCRIVAVSAVKRFEQKGRTRLQLKSLPAIDGAAMDERDIIDKFLGGAGATKPQLVGFACGAADMPILLQRALVHRLSQPAFCRRPNKPWEGSDYFAKYSDWHVDLLDLVSNYGRGSQTPSLHEICVASGIPGKFLAGGDDVLGLWAAGQITKIVQYNQCDVLSQYELFMRVALLAGLIAPHDYEQEQDVFAQLLAEQIAQGTPAAAHLNAYASERQRIRHALGYKQPDPAPAPASKTEQIDALEAAMAGAGV